MLAKPDRFTARTLFLRAALAVLQRQDPSLCFGQLKTLLDGGIQPAPSRNVTVLELLGQKADPTIGVRQTLLIFSVFFHFLKLV